MQRAQKGEDGSKNTNPHTHTTEQKPSPSTRPNTRQNSNGISKGSPVISTPASDKSTTGSTVTTEAIPTTSTTSSVTDIHPTQSRIVTTVHTTPHIVLPSSNLGLLVAVSQPSTQGTASPKPSRESIIITCAAPQVSPTPPSSVSGMTVLPTSKKSPSPSYQQLTTTTPVHLPVSHPGILYPQGSVVQGGPGPAPGPGPRAVYHDPTRHPPPFTPEPQGLTQATKRLSPFVVHHTLDQTRKPGKQTIYFKETARILMMS